MEDVQSLVERAKAGDTVAYDNLVNHYVNLAGRRANQVASRKPSVDPHDLESALVWAMQRCFETYDPSIAPFEHLVNRSWTKETTGTIHKAVRSSHNRVRAMSIDSLPSQNGDADALAIDDTVDVEAELLADLAVLDYRRKAREEDMTLEKVVVLLALGGYTYAEIARKCGFIGSDDAAKMWTLRAIDRLRRVFVNVGATVRVKLPGTKLDGQIGQVVRFATGDQTYTHIVRFEDGRIRAFRIGEIEVVEN